MAKRKPTARLNPVAAKHPKRAKPNTCTITIDPSRCDAIIRANYELWLLVGRLEDPATGSAVDAAAELRAILERMLKP